MQATAILLPTPQQLVWETGSFSFSDHALILLDSDSPQSLLPAGGVIEKALWTQLRVNWEMTASRAVSKAKIKIRIELMPINNARSQLYKLEITPNNITLQSSEPVGLFYAAQTLAQLIRQFGYEIPCVQIEDWPDFPYRGVMLDISRDKVYKNETLYELVDRLASIKVNQIQLYTEHTFAYHNHPEVWQDASPMTGEDILALDRYCKDRFIELVPNQNSFGHMTRWLKHERYAPLAEINGEFDVPWGKMEGPFSLAPVDPGSLELVSSMYDELLPHFTSKMVNIGCDETFDLGAGKSKAACSKRGIGAVYLDFLLKLYANISAHGTTVQFWGDILLQHPDLVPLLPKDMIALEWGYEADHPFAEHAKIFAASGLEFYVCPGTSAWNSISGRTDNALKNLLNAAENGKENRASGYLITDWGDNGHWQVLPISFLGYAMGAAYSWSCHASKDINVSEAVSRFMFDDPSGIMGKLAFELGNLYKKTGKEISNSSVLFQILQSPLATIHLPQGSTSETYEAIAKEIDQVMSNLAEERMTRPDAVVLRSEMQLSAKMLKHACRRGLALIQKPVDSANESLRNEWVEIIEEYKRLWLIRNRPGGMEDSVRRMELILSDYE